MLDEESCNTTWDMKNLSSCSTQELQKITEEYSEYLMHIRKSEELAGQVVLTSVMLGHL